MHLNKLEKISTTSKIIFQLVIYYMGSVVVKVP